MAVTINASTSSGVITTADNSGVLQLQTNNGTTAMTIDTSQNVGIGTSSPTAILQVNSTAAIVRPIVTATTGYTDWVVANTGGNIYFGIDNSAGGVSGTAYGRHIYSDGAYPLDFFTNSTQRMRIDSAGNVGIGINSPTSILDVRTSNPTRGIIASIVNTATSSQTGAQIRLTQNGIEDWVVGQPAAANAFAIWSGRSASADGTERMRIDSSGNVLVGTTTSAFSSAGRGVIELNGSSTAYYALKASDAVKGSFNFASAKINIEANSIPIVFGSTGGTEWMRIDTSGNITITGATATKASGTTWANPSDIRLKDNVQDFNKGLTELLQVNVKTWEYNGKGGTVEGTKGIGVIADEIETVLPETVDTYKAKLNIDDTEEADIKRFDATEITWLLVKSIQEQQTIINDLKARIETLEAK